MAVHVDLCAEGGWCLDSGCLMPAQLAMQVDGEELPREYCAGCVVPRLGLHRTRGAQITYSDGAGRLLGLAPGSQPDTPEQIQADHPGWHCWRTRRGEELVNWAASLHDPKVGVSRTVICPSSEALRAALVDERMLAARGPYARQMITR